MAEAAVLILERLDALLAYVPAGVLLLIGIPLMLFGAEWLVRGAISLARRFGVSTLIIGLTVVAAGTSAPELAINIIAAVSGNPGLSFGNVIGSNIANIGLVIGIGAIIMPMVVHSRVLRIELPWLMVISLATIGLALIPMMRAGAADESLGFPFGFGWIDGLILTGGFLAFVVLWFRTAKQDGEDPLTQEAIEQAERESERGAILASSLFLVGLLALLAGGKLTEVGAVRTAEYFDLTHAVIGMTVLAISTSLPELVIVIIACRKGYTDLAMGNVVGSNIFNILLVLGVTSVIADVPIPGVGGWQDLIAMIALTAVFWWMAASGRPRVSRPAGVLLLITYVLYIGWGVTREAADIIVTP